MIKNKIYNGDCLELMKGIPDGSVDMILCDLPYGTTQNKWDTVLPFVPVWEQYERLIKPNGAIVLTAAQPFTSALVMSNTKMFKYTWVWEKPQGTGHLNAKKQPLRSTEDILVFYKNQCTYNPQFVGVDKRFISRKRLKRKVNDQSSCYGSYKNNEIENYEGRYPKNVLRFNSERGIHPTQKPVPLFEYLIKTYTNPGELVLDNCAGSGTTAIACMNTGREFICMEKDIGIYNVAKARIDEHDLFGF